MTYKIANPNFVVREADHAAIPFDPANRDYQDYLAWLAAGNVPTPLPGPTPEQLVAQVEAAIQAELDRQAQAKGYDSILSACTYAMQPANAPFQAEGAAFVTWRSAVWHQARVALAAVQAGTKPMPTPAEAVAAMPALVLP
jgi:hypothetical protein